MDAVSETVDTATESIRSVFDLGRKAVDTQIRLSQEYLAVAQKVFSGDADAAAAGRAYLESVQRESTTYVSRMTDLGITFGNGVLDLGDTVARSVLGEVSAAAGSSRSSSSRSSGTKKATVTKKVAGSSRRTASRAKKSTA